MTRLIKTHISEFPEVLTIIKDGRSRAFQAVNVVLIETYWAVGGYLSRKVAESGWGKGVIRELADWLRVNAPEAKGFSASNLWRMMQLYDTYVSNERLAPLVRTLSWSKNLLMLGQCQRWPVRSLLAVKSNVEKSFFTGMKGIQGMKKENQSCFVVSLSSPSSLLIRL